MRLWDTIGTQGKIRIKTQITATNQTVVGESEKQEVVITARGGAYERDAYEKDSHFEGHAVEILALKIDAECPRTRSTVRNAFEAVVRLTKEGQKCRRLSARCSVADRKMEFVDDDGLGQRGEHASIFDLGITQDSDAAPPASV